MENVSTQMNPTVMGAIATFATADAKQIVPVRITIPLLMLDNCFLSIRRKAKIDGYKETELMVSQLANFILPRIDGLERLIFFEDTNYAQDCVYHLYT